MAQGALSDPEIAGAFNGIAATRPPLGETSPTLFGSIRPVGDHKKGA